MVYIKDKLNIVIEKTSPIRNQIYMGYIKNFKFWLEFTKRKMNFPGTYSELARLKNTKKGRCFIVATGPSLTYEDLGKLKNEVTFGMNALCKSFSTIGWETTYYGIQDLQTYKNLKTDIDNIKTTIFYSLNGQKRKADRKIDCELQNKKNAIKYPLYYSNHLYNSEEWNTKFSNDAYCIVYDGYTIAYSLIQIAVYIGYKEIYLIGTDCNYTNEKKRYFIDSGVKNSNFPILGSRMIYAYKIAKQFADLHGVKIYNATRGGMLEVFPRVDLDEVLTR